MTKVTIDNKEYELNLNQAVEAGFLKPINPCPVVSGGVYQGKSGEKIIIFQTEWYADKYGVFGLRDTFQPFAVSIRGIREMETYLRDGPYKPIGTLPALSDIKLNPI